jgi:porin
MLLKPPPRQRCTTRMHCRRQVRSVWAQDALTIDWAPRQSLARAGVDVIAGYIGEVLANPTGGERQGATYGGLLQLGLELDLETAFGWKGGLVHAMWYAPHGASLTDRYVGDLGVVSGIDAYDSFRLFELWAQQTVKFAGGEASLRIGQMAADEEFALSEYAALFVAAGFGAPTAIAGNFPAPLYPFGALGARLQLQVGAPEKRAFIARFAAFDGNPAPGEMSGFSPHAANATEHNHYGTHWALRAEEGALLIAELGHSFHQPPEHGESDDAEDARRSRGKHAASPAPTKLGLIVHTGDLP